MKILELFSGTESFSKVAREKGHQTFTIDNNPKFHPDLCIDIMKLKLEDIPFTPDVIWASPPCTTFSVASIGHYWKKPKDATIDGILFVCKTIALIYLLKPKYWFIENPMGMLRSQWFMKGMPRKTITYCQYGDTRMKPTDIWTNAGLKWIPKPMCKNGDLCHESAPRGTRQGTQGLKGNMERSVIPPSLCEEIIKSIEVD